MLKSCLGITKDLCLNRFVFSLLSIFISQLFEGMNIPSNRFPIIDSGSSRQGGVENRAGLPGCHLGSLALI